MAGRAIVDEQNEAMQVTGADLLQEFIHTGGVHRRENEITGIAVEGTDRPVGIGVFADDLGGNLWPAMLRSPASPGLGDASETRLVLEEHFKRLAYRLGLPLGVREERGPVFLKASWASLSAFGCFGRGATFRQPWRRSKS